MKLTKLVVCCAFVFLTAGSALSQGKTSLQYLEDGSRYYLAHDYKNAIPPYLKALELEKKERKLKRELWIVLVDNLSMAYGVTGDIENSQKVIAYGIKEEPTYPLFYYNMACGFGEQDNESGAVENLRLAFKYRDNMIAGESLPDPERDSSFARLIKRESFRKAVAAMKKTSQPSSQTNEPQACGQTDYRCQLDYGMKAIQAHPKDPENYYNVGLIFLKSGNPAEAVQVFDMYLAIPGVKPELQADGYNNRGMAYKQLKQYDLAYADYSKALELNPNCAICLVNRGNLGNLGANAARPVDAMSNYNQAIQTDPKNALAYANRGHLYALQGKNDEALKDLAMAISLDPADAEPYYTRAMVYRGKRDFAAAILDLNAYIDRIAGNDRFLADAYLNRAIAYAMIKNPDQAEKDVTRAIELAPDYVDAYKTRAVIYRDAKKLAQAAADEKKAAELMAKQQR